MSMPPWFPMENVNDQRTFGKAMEEFGELVSATARCLIQGIDEREPVTGKLNRSWLEDEIADAEAQIEMIKARYSLNLIYIEARRDRKIGQMIEWQAILMKPYDNS